MSKVVFLRFIHGLFALYFFLCLLYIYYAALFSRIDLLLLVALISLGIEGTLVFVLNKGDCPLIYVQRKIGDNTPFFNLFLPANLAKQAVPILAKLTWVAVAMLLLRLLINLLLR